MTRNWGERIRIIHGDQVLFVQVDLSDDLERTELRFGRPNEFWICATPAWGEVCRIVCGTQSLSIQVNKSHKGDRAQLAIAGPQDFRIVRDELQDAPPAGKAGR